MIAHHKRTLAPRASICASALALAAVAHAGTPTPIDWDNAAGGMWSNAANWNPMLTPDNGGGMIFDVTIADLAGAYNVNLDIPAIINSLQLTGADPTLDLDTQTLTIDADYTQNGAILRSGAGTGAIDVSGVTMFTDIMIESLSSFTTNGDLIFASSICDDICDTPIVHFGDNLTWSGTGDIRLMGDSSLTNGPNSTFDIQNDQMILWDNMGAGSALINDGMITKSSTGGVTEFLDITFTNNGSVDISNGTFRTNGVDVNGNSNTLQTGAWIVSSGAEIDLVGQMILTNQADITIDGATSTFNAVNPIQINDTGAALAFTGGADFTTAGDFTNDGALTVGDATTFEVVTGADLLSFNSGTNTLEGGAYNIAGTLQFDDADIQNLDAELTLDGPTSAVLDQTMTDALTNLAIINPGGRFDIRNGRNFNTVGDFTNDGFLAVGAGSELAVAPGFTLTNFAGGILSDANFDIQGTLRFDNAAIVEIGTDLVLDGPGSAILDQINQDALSNLNRINADGRLTLRNGRELDIVGDLNVEGELIIEPPVLSSRGISEPNTLDLAGSLIFEQDSTFEVLLAGTAMGVGYGVTETAADLIFMNPARGEAMAGTISVKLADGYVPTVGDFYDVIFFQERDGVFADSAGLNIGGSLQIAVEYHPDRVRLVVIPAPAPIAALLLASPVIIRRRR